MSNILSPSNLVEHELTDAASDVETNLIANITLLNDTLLKMTGMADVNFTSLSNGQGFRWDAGSSKFVNVTPTP